MAKKMGYEAYLEDQKKREEEAKKGQVRYVEAAKASRIQYSLPQYQGKSQNQGKTYQWERDLMQNTKVKGAGNSYTKKFDALTSRMGMTDGQASEFRKYMDWLEDSKSVKPKMNKDGSINQNQSLKYARDTHLESDVIDGILNNMNKTGAQNVRNASNPTVPKKKEPNKFLNGLMKAMEIIDRPGDAVRTGIKEKAEGRSFWEGAKDGFTGDKNTSGTELNKLIGLDPEKNENQKDISRTINSNLLNTFGLGMAVNAFTPDEAKDYAATQTPGAATETLLDPLNLVGGAATKAPRKGLDIIGNGLGRFAKVEGELPTFSGNVSDNVLDSLAPTVAQDKTLGGNVPSQSNDMFSRLLGQETPKPQTKTDAWNNFKLDEIPTVEKPTNILDELLFGQRGNGPKARGAIDQVPMARYAKDNISDMGTNILNRSEQLNQAPEGGYNQRLLDIQNEMKANKNLTVDQARAFEEAQKVLDQRKAYEDAHVEQELAPYAPSQQQAAEAQMKWENVVKQAQQDADHIKQTFGKIHVPKGAAEDYPIPPQFRASYGDKASDDIFSFADQMGFSSADEAVQYLQRLDQDSKVKLKDMMPDRNSQVSPSQWEAMEQAARRNFEQSDAGKSIDTLLEDLLNAGKSTDDIEALYQAHKGPNDPATFDEMIKLAEMENNAKPVPKDIKSMLRNDPKVAEEIRKLNALGGVKTQEPSLNGNYGQGNLQGIDDILSLLGKNSENVNNSQAPEQVLESLIRPKKAETEAIKPETAPASEIPTVTQGAETSSNMKPLGISAGQPKVNDISWVEEPQSFIDKVKSGKENAGTVGRKLKTEVISDLQPVKDVERSIASMDDDGVLRTILGSDTNVSAEDSLFKGLRGVRRSVSEAMKAAKEDYGSILKTLRTNKISKRDFDEYVSAVHFNDVLKNNHDLAVREGEVSARLEEIEQLGQGTNDKTVLKQLADEEKALLKEKSDLEPYKLPASATEENVNRILKRWENTPAMKQAQKAFMNAQNKDLDLLVQSGVYSEATANAMKATHPNYIYMGRAKEEDSMLGVGGNSSKPNKFILKRANGSEENLKYSPLESAVRNRLLTYSNARRNSAMQQIEKLASVNGASKYFAKLNPNTSSPSQMRNSVKFFVDGVEQRYEVPPALKDAFDNIDAKNAKDLVSSSLRAVANVTRKGATYFNTDFIFSSVFRDANGLITSRTNMHPGELILGYMDSFMGKGLERMSGGKFKSYKHLYEEMGGHQTGFVTLDPQSTKQFMKDMDKGTLGKGIKIIDPRKWPEVITKFGGAIEHGPKLGEFRSAKNKGLGDADAMHEATEVIDYTDQGSTIRNWNDKIPFLNPAIRGNTRYFQAAKENFPAWMGKNLLYVTTPTVGIYMMRYSPTTSDEQRSKLRNMSEYQKNMFWHIPVPNSEQILSIPKMHTAAQLFGNPIERALDLAFEDNPKSVSRILKDTGADSLNVLVPPSAVAGVNQIKNAIANYDPLMDMPIEDLTMQKNPDKTEHYNSFTSEVAKGLGNTFNQSPAKIDYILKSLTGGTGRDVLDLTDNVLAKTGAVDRPQKVDTILDILNPARRYQYKDTSGLETSSELYEQQKRDSFNGNKDSDAVQLYSDMKALNKEIKGIRESTELSSQEKKEAISSLREQQRAIGDEAIKLGILKNR